MDTMDLNDDLADAIDSLMRAKGLNSRVEVVREAVERMAEQERELADLKVKLRQGLDSIAAGRVKPAADVFDRLLRKYESAEPGGAA